MFEVFVQTDDFDPSAFVTQLAKRNDAGAVASFIGLVKKKSVAGELVAMTLEHYPGMTEKTLADIQKQAHQRWGILHSVVVHRYGRLLPGDRIVLVAVSSEHREAAFLACHFIMDYLKTQAPFWKQEETKQGKSWVESRASDEESMHRWKT